MALDPIHVHYNRGRRRLNKNDLNKEKGNHKFTFMLSLISHETLITCSWTS